MPNVKLWRQNAKIRAVRCFNNKCCICNYDKCIQALEFHHLIPGEKDFSFSKHTANPTAWETLVIELKKCIMVCANCHREIHYKLVSIPENVTKFNEDLADYQLIEKSHCLCICGVRIPSSQLYCSNICKAKNREIIDWEKETSNIIDMKDKQKLSFVKIGKVYGVSDKTIAKWYYRSSNQQVVLNGISSS